MSLSDVLPKVIDLGRKVRAYYDAELPKRLRNYPLIGPDEEEPPPPPEEKELNDFLASLPEEMIYQLILLMYLGRGKVSADGLATYYESLKDVVGDPEQAAAQMMWYKGVLADQVSDGLEELAKHKINVDKLPLKKVKVRKR